MINNNIDVNDADKMYDCNQPFKIVDIGQAYIQKYSA